MSEQYEEESSTDWKEFREALLQDSEARKAFENIAAEYNLASMLISIRTRHDLSQVDMARAAGYEPKFIYDLEAGRIKVTEEILHRILIAVGEGSISATE